MVPSPLCTHILVEGGDILFTYGEANEKKKLKWGENSPEGKGGEGRAASRSANVMLMSMI